MLKNLCLIFLSIALSVLLTGCSDNKSTPASNKKNSDGSSTEFYECVENLPSLGVDKNKIVPALEKAGLKEYVDYNNYVSEGPSKPSLTLFLKKNDDLCIISTSVSSYELSNLEVQKNLELFQKIINIINQTVVSNENVRPIIEEQLQSLQKINKEGVRGQQIKNIRASSDYLFLMERQPITHDYKYFIIKKQPLDPNLKPLGFDVSKILWALKQTQAIESDYELSSPEFSSLYYSRLRHQITFLNVSYTNLFIFGDEFSVSSPTQLHLQTTPFNDQANKIIQSFSMLICKSDQERSLFNKTLDNFQSQIARSQSMETDLNVKVEINGYLVRMSYMPTIKLYTFLVDKV